MIFPQLNAPLRTDAEFRSGVYDQHHKYKTILETVVGLDMIKDFPIGDVLHLIDLGITKRFLYGWKLGNLHNFNAKWSANDIRNVSDFLNRTKMPREIKRRLRGLDELSHWKGTEYRTFLLYVSIVIVKNYFKSEEIYEHFLHFFCAIVICSRPDQCKANYEVARQLLLHFLKGVKLLYGSQLFSSNMHNLCHLVDDVEKFGPLDTFSAYPFESKLYHLKKLVRTGNLPLSQVSRRITEIQQNLANKIKSEADRKRPCFRMKYEDFSKLDQQVQSYLRANPEYSLYSVLRLEHFCLNTECEANKWILTEDFKVISVKYITHSPVGGSIILFGYPLKSLFDYFIKPIRSTSLQIYATNLEKGSMVMVPLKKLYCKMVKVDVDDNLAVMLPLIHTLA